MQCERASGETCLFIWTFVKCPPPPFFSFFFCNDLALTSISFGFFVCFCLVLCLRHDSEKRKHHES